METRETFIITLFHDKQRNTEPKGRLRHVASNREIIFKDLNELNNLLRKFLDPSFACKEKQGGFVFEKI